MKPEITCFISYTWHSWQKGFAQAFAAEVRKWPDFEVWIDDEQVLPGQALYTRLAEGLRRESDCAICLISPEYLRSENCQKELYEAHTNCFKQGKPLVAVKIGKCELPFPLRDLVFEDLSNAVDSAGRADTVALAAGVERLTEQIRRLLEPRVDLLRFFAPRDRTAVRLVSNKCYVSPFAKKSFSTTTRFTDTVGELLRTLEKRAAIPTWSAVHPEYVENADFDNLVKGDDSLISYASSKINPVTDQMLRRLETTYKTTLRFVFQDDLKKGLAESRFPDFDKSRRVSLLLKDATLTHEAGKDYGLLVRAPEAPKASKTWWIVAGCGRPGSAAVYQTLFDLSWQEILWPRLSLRLPDAFYAVIAVEYDPAFSDMPTSPEVVDFRILG
jgi:hypothetical protein